MNKIRFGIVGFGHIGNKHYQHIVAHPNADIVAVCDIDPEKTKSIAQGKKIEIFSSIADMLHHCKVDVLCVCTPNYLHCEQTILGLENDCHVLVEKPMALKVSDCERMIQKSAEKGKKIFTVMQNRFAPSALWMKDLINNDVLGQLYQIQVNCFWNRNKQYYEQSNWRGTKEKDGGVLFTQFSHFIDILYYLHGDMADYKGGMIANYNHPYIEIEDSGSFVMESKKKATISFNYSICAQDKNMESSITIISEKGTIKIGGQYLNTIEYCHLQDKNIIPPDMKGNIPNDYGFYQGSMNNHDKVIGNVIDHLRLGSTIISSAEDGLAVVNIIENMYKIVRLEK